MAEVHPILHYLGTPGGEETAHFAEDEQAILDTVNRKVAAAATLDELVDFLFSTIPELYPCDRIGIALVEDDGRRLVARKARTLYGPVQLPEGYAEDLAGSSLARVLETGCSRLIYDLARYEEEHPRSVSTRLLVREGVRSSLTCPLQVGDRAFGVIFLSTRQPRAYTPYHVRLWRAVAERLGQAVEKVWRIEQLTAANRAYNEVLAFVSHELKNPIASMITDARVLTGGYLGPLEARQTQRLDRLVTKGEYLLSLIGEYLDLARMEGGELRLRPTDADFERDVAQPALEVLQAPLQAAGMRVERVQEGTPGPLACDPGLLRIVLANLLGNAVKYGRPKGLVRLTERWSPTALRVEVWNEGPGFPEEERALLFRKFSRLQSPELKARKGTGVGLYTAWRIVRLHGGRMDAESRLDHWARFDFELPRPLPD